MHISFFPNVIPGGKLYSAFTWLQRTSICFQGRGKSSLPKSCATGGSDGSEADLYPVTLELRAESTGMLRLVVKEPVAFRRQLQHGAEFQHG